jgi:hypothetical protein
VARRPETAEPVENDRLRDYVQHRLAWAIRRPDGTPASGPATPEWKGRNKPRRFDRRWATAWSPEQIAHRLPVGFSEDESVRISHEAICQALYVQSRGGPRRELVACLRTGRALRVPSTRARQRATGHVTPEFTISQRPADDRAVPGHWQGDPAAVGPGGEVPLQQIARAGGELGGHGGAPGPAGHHASAAMTLDRYVHLFGDEPDAVADRMDAARADWLRTEGDVASARRLH